MWIIRAILIAVMLILVIAFAYNNFGPEQKVDVYLRPVLPNYLDVPLVTVVFWSIVAGMVMSLLIFISIYFKQTVDMHAAKRRIKALEGEVGILRNRPIEESAELLKGADSRIRDSKSPFSEG